MQNKDTDIRIDFNRNLFKNEIEIHGERQQVLLCMKNRLSWKICSQIMDDESPGFLVKIIPKTILEIKDFLKKNSYLHFMLYILKKASCITNIYLDLVKDLLLVITIVSALGGFEVIFGNIKAFPSVVSIFESFLQIILIFILGCDESFSHNNTSTYPQHFLDSK